MKAVAPIVALAVLATAKTDLEGCTSFTSMVTVRTELGYGNTYATVIWYDPDNLEICEGVDCGGGRAPPKTVPGCPAYHGTETITPSFLTEDPLKPAATPEPAPSETATDEKMTETVDIPESTSFAEATEKPSTVSEKGETSANSGDIGQPSDSSAAESRPASTTSSPIPTGTQDTASRETTQTTPAGDDASENNSSPEETETDTPAGAIPTAAVALNLAAGAAAAYIVLL